MKRTVCAALLAAAGLRASALPVSAAAVELPGQARIVPASGETWIAVRINGQEPADIVRLDRLGDGRLMVRRIDLERWRMRIPESAPVLEGGDAWYPLDVLHGLSYQMDEPRQALNLIAPPALFEATRFDGATLGSATPTRSSPGVFANYDVSFQRSEGHTVGGALLGLGAFNRLGALDATFVARSDAAVRLARLDTTLTQDRPGELASFRLGDAASGAGAWGQPVRFGGVQWATNFATQPEYVTFPMPGVAGEAALPSTVDLYVNDALRMTRNVPTGPFSIQDLPVITGEGEARIVIRDALGRERIVTQPYYATPRLLKRGLQEFSYEAGVVRENYGLQSNDYGRAIAVATHRVGITDRFTIEGHGEVLREQQTAGAAATLLVSAIGTVSASFASSRTSHGTGTLVGLGIERSARWLGFGADYQATTEKFVQLGLQPGMPAPRDRIHAFASVGGNRYGSFSVNCSRERNRDGPDVNLRGASYAINVGRIGFLGVSALHSGGDPGGTAVAINFTVPLDARTAASVGATIQPGSDLAQVDVQRSLPAGSGFGYHLLAGGGEARRLDATLAAQGDAGLYSVEVARDNGQTAERLQAAGSIGWLGGHAFASRPITESFAVAQVPGYPDVRVYADNQLIARTDASGTALIPRMRPYQRNPVRIEQEDLPMDAQVDQVQIDAVPYLRSGVVLRFPVKRSRGATLTLLLDDGQPMPAGALATLEGGAEEFPVGLRGELYLSGLEAQNRVRVGWHGRSCEFALGFPPSSDPVPDLGIHRCSGVNP